MRPPFRVKRPDCHNAEVIGRGWGAVFALGAILTVSWADAPRAAAAECAASTSAADLDAFFAADGAGGLAGADYPHAYALPDGRTLWLFQDAFVGADGDLVDDHFAHNAALIQTGSCFSLLPTSGGQGTSWLGSWVEEALGQWFWPLDAEIGADGNLWLFLAEVRNPNRSGAATGAEPVATWRARYRLPDLELLDMEQAADSSSSLYGYSIVSDNDWTYLYGHCYRQFVPGEEYGFDPSCSPHAYLARVPKGQLDRRPYYWTGTGWSRLRDGPRARVDRPSASMPVSVERFGDVYVAASDEGDWYGGDIVIRTAHAPQGPWTEVAAIHAGHEVRRATATTTARSSSRAWRTTRSSSPTRTMPGTCTATRSGTRRGTASACGPLPCPGCRAHRSRSMIPRRPPCRRRKQRRRRRSRRSRVSGRSRRTRSAWSRSWTRSTPRRAGTTICCSGCGSPRSLSSSPSRVPRRWAS